MVPFRISTLRGVNYWPRTALVNGAGTGLVEITLFLGTVVEDCLVVDTTKVADYTIESIADYTAVLALSLVQSPDHCDPLPSILDLMSSSCGMRERPAGVTAGDLAFLKALYYHNTGLGPTLSREEIQTNMMRQFKAQ